MPPPLPNPSSALWCCAGCLSQSARASPLPVHVLLSTGCAPAPGCAASRSSIISLCAAFFRLVSVAHRRFIPLKAGVLIQDGVGGITERLVIGNLLVVDLPRVGLTQIPYPFGLGRHYHHILVAVGLVLATVVQSLFCRALRALPAAVGPIDDQFYRLFFAARLVSKLAWSAFGHDLQGFQGLLQQGEQVMHPVVHARLAQLEYLAQQ